MHPAGDVFQDTADDRLNLCSTAPGLPAKARARAGISGWCVKESASAMLRADVAFHELAGI
jgi:hypothetical protein